MESMQVEIISKSKITIELTWRNRLSFLRLAFGLFSKQGIINLDAHIVEIKECEDERSKNGTVRP